jgi:LacI family transcriptional regulator
MARHGASMSRRFRIAFGLRNAAAFVAQSFFVGAHTFGHSRHDWEIVRVGGSTQLSWEEALAARPDGILGAIVTGDVVTRRAVGRARVVIVNQSVRDHPFDRVVADSAEAGRRAADHLREHELTRFAYVGSEGQYFSELRRQGFSEALASHEFKAAETTITDRGLVGWLRDLPKPCGVFCANDGVAVRVIHRCLRAGIKIPEDIAVVGVSNDQVTCVESPIMLTSVTQNFEQVGWQAAARLDVLLRQGPCPAETRLVPPGAIVERESTRLIAVTDSLVRQALEIIRSDHDDPITLPGLIERIGPVSRRLLELRFQSSLGRSPYREILLARVRRAQRLLRETRRPITEIAQTVGFYDAAQFARHFRRLCGQSASAYRGDFPHQAALRGEASEQHGLKA